MEDIRLLATTMQTEKKKKLDLIRQMAPRKLDQASGCIWIQQLQLIIFLKVDELSSILLNNSLSGNEKVIWISHVLLELPNEHQKSLQRLFNQEFMLITKPFGGMPDQHSHSLPTLNENILETNRNTVTALKNNDNLLMVSNRNQQENRIIPAIKETPSKIDVRKNDFPFLNQLNTTPSTNNASITFGVPHLEIPPTIYNHNDPGERYIDLMTKNRRPIVGQPPSHSVFGTPILPVIQNNGRPQSVGITNQLKVIPL
uniref:Uncharacterized protein n=1 Tax=Heterorhabditis bacteriophora TaxID=37862 RepID=A0A1I7WRK2_HETBA